MNTTSRRNRLREEFKPIIIDLRTPAIDLPLYVYVTLVVFLVLATVCIIWVAIVWQDVPASNPFSEYVNAFPGQSEKQVKAQGFNCNKYYFPWNDSNYCLLLPKQGPFQEISIITMD